VISVVIVLGDQVCGNPGKKSTSWWQVMEMLAAVYERENYKC